MKEILKFAGIVAFRLLYFAPAIFLVWIFSKIDIYTKGSFKKTLKVGCFIFVLKLATLMFVFYGALGSLHVRTRFRPIIHCLNGLFYMFCVAFIEESVFRGVVLNLIAKKYAISKSGVISRSGVWFSCIISGIIFGASHMTNLPVSKDIIATISQSIMAAAAGVCYSAIYIRGGNIWVLIIIHFLNNTAGLFDYLFVLTDKDIGACMNEIHTLESVLIVVPMYTLISIFILRKYKSISIT